MYSSLTFSSPLGDITLIATDTHLVRILWTWEKIPEIYGNLRGSNPLLEKAKREFKEYFSWKRKMFNIPLLFESGTELEQKTWNNLMKIPYGNTISYGELAEMNGRPRAYRAAGTANGKNPLPIIVPCHRVIASDGSIWGYSGWLDVKRYLLELEKSPRS
jgi:methylated-DNA-[protein]-cysteine S-methyltransferase